MWLILSLLPLVAVLAGWWHVRKLVQVVRQRELSHVVFALEGLDELLRTRRNCLPELLNICRVFTDYQRQTLTKLRELHSSLEKDPDTANRVLLENALSEFLRDLVKTLPTHAGLERNVFLQRLLQQVFDAEARIAERRPSLNQRIDAYNNALDAPILARFGRRFGLVALRRLDMTAHELLRATSVFGASQEGATLDASPVGQDVDDSSGGDEVELSEDVDEFGYDPEDVPRWSTTPNAEEEAAAAVPAGFADEGDDGDDLRCIDVEDDDSLISTE